MTVIDTVLIVISVVLGFPIALVALETIAAIWWHFFRTPRDTTADAGAPRPSLAVLIPAHNEEAMIARALASVLPQLLDDDRLIIVADNCTDGTADIARWAGAEVVVRSHDTHRGKGYALAAGIDYLRTTPPAVLAIVDADMNVSAGSLDLLAREALRYDAAVQAVDLLDSPAKAATRVQISALAFTFKNLVRALGADALGIPCLLRGTGMAFPWHLIQRVRFATGNIVEDMQLGMDLAIAKSAPRFCPDARITGKLPRQTAAASVQRTRWEHGHLQTILHNVPALLWQGIRQRRFELIALAADLAVPPLALLVMAWCFFTVVAVGGRFAGVASAWPAIALLSVGTLLLCSIVAGWAVFGRRVLPARSLLSIPSYLLWKIPLYFAFLFNRQQTWIRTERAS